MTALLQVAGLAAGYGGPPVIEDVTFELEQGERIGVLGPNGGGKSTLFRVLLGELRPLRGSVRRPPRLGFVPQTERSRLDYPVSALDVALMGTLSRVPWWRPVGRRERRAALAALERVGLAALADEQFGELSGGQRQRVLAARALVQDAPVLLFVGVVGAGLGCGIVLYELAYGAESLAHALFPGLVAAALLGLPLLLGAAGGVLGAAAAVALATRLPGIGRDVAVAVVVTTLFGLGVLLALTPASPPGLDGLLFGDLLGVTRGDLAASGVLAALSLVALAALHRPLLAVGFDRGSSASLGARPLVVDLGLLALIAAAIVVGVQGLGNLLVLAALIGPAATARLLVRRVPRMMLLATVVAVVCALGGLYLSYYADVAAGAAVAGSTVAAYLALTLVRLRPWRLSASRV